MPISSTRKRRRLYRDGAKTLFGDKCQRCGYDKHWEILEFHHIIPKSISKRPNIQQVISWSWKKVRNEILEHTTLLCPTCHSELHWELENGKAEHKDHFRFGSRWFKPYKNMGINSEGTG